MKSTWNFIFVYIKIVIEFSNKFLIFVKQFEGILLFAYHAGFIFERAL